MKVRDSLEFTPSFFRSLLKIAVPVILQSLITTGVNLIDTLMLGRLGETALSASSLSNQFITLFTFAIMGIAMGASVLASRFWGAQDLPRLKKVTTIALRAGLALATVFTLVNTLFPGEIMRFYILQEDVVAAGRSYLLYSAPTYLLFALTTITTNLLRSSGITRVSLYGALAAFFVNIGANYLLIFGKLGLPAMGVAGAALGTVIARIVECGIVAGYFFMKQKVRYRLRDLLTPCGDLLREFLRISIPVMLSDSLLGVGESVLAMIMGRIGSGFVSANAIANVVQRVSTIFITGLSFAGCFMIGNTLGAGKNETARRQGNSILLIGLFFGLVAAVVIESVKAPVIRSYQITAETQQIAYQLMHGISVIVIFRATNSVLTKGVLRGGGDTTFLVVADLSTMWLLAIPIGALAGLVLHLSAFWIYLALHLDQIVKAIWCIFRLRSGKWIRYITTSNS